MPNDGTGANWDETSPQDSDSIANGALEIRDLRVGVDLRLAKEHQAPATSTAGGEHLHGSARAYIGSSFPTKRPDTTTDLASGDDGRLLVRPGKVGTLYFVNTDGVWEAISILTAGQIANGIIGTDQLASAGSKASKFAVVSQKQDDGANGGTFTAGGWRTRDLNDETYDNDTIVSVSSSQMSLVAGTYRVEWFGQAYKVGSHQTRLRNVTDNQTIAYGMTALSVSSDSFSSMTGSNGSAEFTLTDTKLLELQHRCQTTVSNVGYGTPGSFGANEYYAQVKIWKVG